MKLLKILIVEDNPSDVDLIKRALRSDSRTIEIQIVDNRKGYEHALDNFLPDVVLSDHTLPEFNSSEALRLFEEYKKERDEPTAFILITGSMSEEFAVKKIQEGVDDYILKDRMERLSSAIKQALHKNFNELNQKKAAAEQGRLLNYIRLLLKSTHDGIYGVNELGICTFINNAALNMLGYKRDECIGVNMHRLIQAKKKDKRHYPEKTSPVYACFTNHVSCRIEDEVFWKCDGSYFHAEYHCSPVVEDGICKGAVVMFIDISQKVIQQKKRELIYCLNKIFDDEEELEQCLDYLIKEICIYEQKFAGEIWITNINDSEVRLCSSFIQTGSLNFSGEKSNFRIEEGFVGNVLHSKKFAFTSDVQQDQQYLRKRYANLNNLHAGLAVPVLFKDKPIAVIILYSNQIEKFKTPEFALQEDLLIQIGQSIFRKKTENELSTIFNYSPDMICIVGDDLKFKKVNPAFTNILGYTEKKIRSQSINEFIYEDDQEITMNELDKLQRGKSIVSFQTRFLGKDGSVKWMTWTFSILNIKGLFMGIGKDVTQRLKLEEQLQTEKIRQQIEITDAVMTAQECERQKIGSELHDNVCQLLALSSMYIGMTRKELNEPSENLQEASKLIADAMNDIRNLSHELIPVMFNKKSVTKSIEELASNIIYTTNLEVSFTVDGFEDELLNEELKLSLYRIIQEQFNNIIKHAKAKEVKITLGIINSEVFLNISDDGCGFDTQKRSKGIGLLNMETRVEVFKGRINLISSPGHGCLLDISIPLEPTAVI